MPREKFIDINNFERNALLSERSFFAFRCVTFRLSVLFLFAFLSFTSFSQGLVSGEYFLDHDPGVGQATAFTLSGNDTISDIVSVSTSGLSSGFHTAFFRVKNNLGRWSHYERASFYILTNSSAENDTTKLVSGEWFIDHDPGIGNGTSFLLNNDTTFTGIVNVSTAGIAPGFHEICFRVKDNNGSWSHYEKSSLYILPNANANSASKLVSGEYFFDHDPGIGNGVGFSFPASDTLTNFPLTINVGSLPDGDHTLQIRVQDSAGKWSHYETRAIYVCGDLIGQPSYYTVSGSTTFCQGDQINVNGVAVNGISDFYWTGPNGYYLHSIVLVRNEATPDMSGDYRFYNISVGGYHCDTNFVTVHVTVNPSYNIYNSVSICHEDSYEMGGQTYTQSGFYQVPLQASTGCDSVVSVSLTILPLNKHTQEVQVCAGSTYTIGNHTYTESGTYVDTLVSYLGCDSIVVTNLYIGDPVLNQSMSLLDSTLTSLEDNATYQWLDCDNNLAPIPGGTNQSIKLTQNGNYAVTLTSTLCPDISVTTNCFHVYNLEVQNAGLAASISVFPNPNKGQFTVIANESQLQLELFDLQGRLLQTWMMEEPTKTIDISRYSAGSYLLHITRNQEKAIFKIEKE